MPTRKKKLKHKKGAWFAPVRRSYIPVSWQGWLTYVPFVAFLIYSYVMSRDIAHNTVEAMLWALPGWILAAAAMTLIAKLTS